MNEKFEVVSWDNIQSSSMDLLVSKERRKQVFQKLGYDILMTGDLKDKLSGKIVEGMDKEPINLQKSPSVALVSGSHNFVRNIAEYSDLLVAKGDLKFISESSSEDN